MRSKSHENNCEPLLAQESAAGEYASVQVRSGRADGTRESKLSILLKILVGLASIISLLVFSIALLSLSARLNRDTSSKGRNLFDLQHPSLYYGLDQVPTIKEMLKLQSMASQLRPTITDVSEHGYPRPTKHPINNLKSFSPSLSVRVSSAQANTSFGSDGWVLLTNTDTAILQFNTPPNRNELCIIQGFFPARNELQGRLLTLEGDKNSIEIWEVAHIPPSEMTHINWNNKPARLNLLDTLATAFGTNFTTKSFTCPKRSSLLLEFNCPSTECQVEYKISDDFFGFQLVIQDGDL